MARRNVMVRRLEVYDLAPPQWGFAAAATASTAAGIDGDAMTFRELQQIVILALPFHRTAGTAELNGEGRLRAWHG